MKYLKYTALILALAIGTQIKITTDIKADEFQEFDRRFPTCADFNKEYKTKTTSACDNAQEEWSGDVMAPCCEY